MPDAAPSLDFRPDEPMRWTPEWHSDVVSVPWGDEKPKGYKRAAGLFTAGGAHIAESHAWRYADEPVTLVPEWHAPQPTERLEGRWLYGGVFYAHFGHFLVESTARLWAAEQIRDLSGIFFFPKPRLTHEFKPLKPYRAFFEHLGLGHLQIRLPQAPVEIATITCPPPGFGIDTMIAGRPEYRDFMRRRLCADVAPEGAEKLYITRSALTSRRGRVVGEERIEAFLAAEGYRIFHPQAHPIGEQIAQYRAARQIVALDGSALHLAAIVADPEAKVALINRGPSMNIEDYIQQFQTFAGLTPTRIEAIRGCWSPEGKRFVKREAQAHLDFRTAAQALHRAGFIAAPAAWSDPSEAELAEHIARLAERLGTGLVYRDLR